MSEESGPSRQSEADEASPFDDLISAASIPQPAPVAAPAGMAFTTAFRGYDKDEVDRTIASLNARLRNEGNELAFLEDRHRREREAAELGSLEIAEKLATADAEVREMAEQLEAAQQRVRELEERIENLEPEHIDKAAQLEADLAAATARAENAEAQVEALAEEMKGGESTNRHQFEEVLRVAEDQASVIIRNATTQADRLLEAAREEISNRRKDAQAEAEGILTRAQHDAQQVQLRIETELTAHQSQIEREAAHAAEKVSQADQEAAAIRSEAEKGAAALRSLVARETTDARAEAEEAVRELRVRALEFEESLTRRQDDAQQEFLVLHNQAVAHAERITQDANEQVAASLEHAQRVAAKADDFDRLARAQSQQIEADAKVRAGAHLERAHAKAQKIIDTVTVHSQSVLRDAEDRTRQLRWQQHQLTSFMAEVKELIRPEGVHLPDEIAVSDEAQDAEADDAAEVEAVDAEVVETDDAEVAEGDTDDAADTDAAEEELEDDPAFTMDVVIDEIPEPRSAKSAADDIEAVQRDA